jgi:hypothetical protein
VKGWRIKEIPGVARRIFFISAIGSFPILYISIPPAPNLSFNTKLFEKSL